MSVSSKQNQKRGLGRGFASLIPTELLDESFDPTASQDQQVSELRQIKINQIVVDSEQPRKQFDQDGLDDLAASIKEHGVVQPIIVTPYGDGYQIVAGERRFRASVIIGLDKIPALVRTLTGQHKLEISLIENLQRKDLNVMETATAYLKLRDQFNLSTAQIGKRIGNKSGSYVSNRIRLLKLPDYVCEMLAGGSLSEGQARPLIGIDEETIKKVIPRIVNEVWSARKVEQFVVDIKKNLSKAKTDKPQAINSQPYEKQLKCFQKYLKTDVKIQTNSKGAGRITIKFKNEKEFERLLKLIG
ncbi:MAG: ParB family transcriptional regulator, chromosome partitioning protein [Patescibacteria group bacterium]|nr:ParB family transcriptional regulator, chromosome partitioning protein [Patescibacteria group bacterium]